MKAIVHIGTEKTGSTSIQEYLYKNRKALKKLGYHFVQSAGTRNNRALPAYCLDDEKYDDFLRAQGVATLPEKRKFQKKVRKAFEKEMRSLRKGIHTVIISSEHFHSRTNTPEEISKVHELLSPFFSEFTIVCYLRDQIETCTSYYSTAIKSGHGPSFANFIRNCTTNNLYYNYFEMLSNWENVFGLDSMDVSLFAPPEFLNGDLLDDFTVKLAPELVGKLDKDFVIENESLSYAGQVLGLAVNRAFPVTPEVPATNALRNQCHNFIYDGCKGKGEQPSIDDQRRIHEEFADVNAQVCERYFPGRPVLFPANFEEKGTDRSINSGFVDALMSVLQVVVDGKDALPPHQNLWRHVPDEYASLLRNAALKLEKEDLKLAFDLMKFAHLIRPSGPFIKRKLDEYRQSLN